MPSDWVSLELSYLLVPNSLSELSVLALLLFHHLEHLSVVWILDGEVLLHFFELSLHFGLLVFQIHFVDFVATLGELESYLDGAAEVGAELDVDLGLDEALLVAFGLLLLWLFAVAAGVRVLIWPLRATNRGGFGLGDHLLQLVAMVACHSCAVHHDIVGAAVRLNISRLLLCLSSLLPIQCLVALILEWLKADIDRQISLLKFSFIYSI